MSAPPHDRAVAGSPNTASRRLAGARVGQRQWFGKCRAHRDDPGTRRPTHHARRNRRTLQARMRSTIRPVRHTCQPSLPLAFLFPPTSRFPIAQSLRTRQVKTPVASLAFAPEPAVTFVAAQRNPLDADRGMNGALTEAAPQMFYGA